MTFSQFVAEIYEDDFNAFSSLAQVRLLPEFVKGPNHPSLYNWCLQVVACIKSSNLSSIFEFLTLALVTPATNVISEPFPWLVLTRSHQTLQCIGVVVCITAFFKKVSLFSKTIYWNSFKMSLRETFDINY